MSYVDLNQRRLYDRERKRQLRAGITHPSPFRAPPQERLRTLEDLQALLERAVMLVERDERSRGVEKSRALTAIASVGLRLVEARDLDQRVEAIEQVLEIRTGAA
jgi:hypothetical protein